MPSEPVPETVDERVRFTSEGLWLEGLFSYPEGSGRPRGTALICPPHPFLGGDMGGSVIRSLRSVLSSLGWAVLVFNYRGIGSSETDRDLGEFQKEFWEKSACPAYESKIFTDAASAFAFLRQSAGPDGPVSLAGYSFGCLPALALAAGRPGVEKIALISPPLAKWPLEERHRRIGIPKAVFWSPGDFACPEETLREAFATLAPPKTLYEFADGGHFYVGRENELARTVASFFGGNGPAQVGKI